MSTLQVNRIIPLTGDSVYIQGAVIDSASFASTASYVASVASSSYSTFAVSASYVLVAQTASFVAAAVSASRATTAANADTASYVLNAVSASYAVTSSYAASVGINFVQSSPSSTWTINHNLNNKYPLVQIYDSSDAVIIPATIVGTNTNTVTVTFSTAISGYARVI
jgi:hypothetical protein